MHVSCRRSGLCSWPQLKRPSLVARQQPAWQPLLVVCRTARHLALPRARADAGSAPSNAAMTGTASAPPAPQRSDSRIGGRSQLRFVADRTLALDAAACGPALFTSEAVASPPQRRSAARDRRSTRSCRQDEAANTCHSAIPAVPLRSRSRLSCRVGQGLTDCQCRDRTGTHQPPQASIAALQPGIEIIACRAPAHAARWLLPQRWRCRAPLQHRLSLQSSSFSWRCANLALISCDAL